MKRHINKFLGVMVLLGLIACSEEKIVDQVINSTTSGGILRNLGETNSLDSANTASTYSILLEAQDAAGGNSLSEVRVNVGFTTDATEDINDVTVTLFSTIPASAFTSDQSTTANGLKAATFSTTYGDLLNHMSLASANVGDRFAIDFEYVMTDGRVFNVGNATGDVVRTGFFSFFNAQFRYGPAVGDPQRLAVDVFATTLNVENKLNRLRTSLTDTVFLQFDEEDDFTTTPTVTALSAIGNPNQVLTPLVDATNDGDRVWYVLYASPADLADTISFAVSGGERVAGFTMKNDTLKSGYIVDNVAPAGSQGASVVSTDASGNILNVTVTLDYEPLGQDTVDFVINGVAPVFDADTITQVITKGDEIVVISFVPQVSGVAIPEQGLDFNILTDPGPAATGAGVNDLVGNAQQETINITLGN